MRFASTLALIIMSVIAIASQSALAQTNFKLLHTFISGKTDGANPTATLARDAAGNLYGGTRQGGALNGGVVFKIDPSGVETVLHDSMVSDGSGPYNTLLLDAAGNLDGVATEGGSFVACHLGCGTVFKLSVTGQESILHAFTGGMDGATPEGGLIFDAAGTLYGTTYAGGTFSAGTVYTISRVSGHKVLYSFTGGADGSGPLAGLVADKAGNFYGTTYLGGVYGLGTVFKIDPSGKETVLHSFANGADGAYPRAGLVLDLSNDLYGTTYQGGTFNYGTIFKMALAGNEKVLHSFSGGSDGIWPGFGTLLRDPSGNFFGTTYYGGASGAGTVFKMDASGGVTILYSFTGGSDGAYPSGGLIRDAAGNLYGTAYEGGSDSGTLGNGTVFELSH